MTRLEWDKVGERRYKTGVSRGVLFIQAGDGSYPAGSGVAWSGLTAINETPSGAEPTKIYADNIVYATLVGAEEFGGTIEALYYPDEWAQCDGSATPQAGVTVGQQARKVFGLAYRTEIGSDTNSGLGYELKLVYGALASPSEKNNNTINDTPEATPFSWDFSTTPVAVTGLKPTAILTIDSTKVPQANLQALEDAIYGTAGTNPRLPSPDEVIAMFAGSQTAVTPTAPTATTAGVITIPTVTGVQYRRADTNAVVTGTVTISGGVGSSLIIRAVPASGAYKFAPGVDDDWLFTKTV